MDCKICKCKVLNMFQHEKTQKHQKNAGEKEIIKPKKYTYDLKQYHKDYYAQNNLKEKSKSKVKCDICDKLITVCNLSHHNKTRKHIIKMNPDILFDKKDLEDSPEEIEILTPPKQII